uniref:Uncharacterized protein n=1 Tax=Amazona collaria TaxID=241587 RepID=A0A8B9FX70_9PSIT
MQDVTAGPNKSKSTKGSSCLFDPEHHLLWVWGCQHLPAYLHTAAWVATVHGGWCLPSLPHPKTSNEIRGYPNLEEAYLKAAPSKIVPNTTCHLPRADAMHLFRDPVSGDLPWTGMSFGLSITATWYWCTDQVNVNKIPLPHVTQHCLGCLKMLPLLIIIMPGMISRVLYPDTTACVDPEECTHMCEATVGCSSIAYPKGAPPTLPGFALSQVTMATLISSLTSILNSSSTLFTMDIWRMLRPGAGEQELPWVASLRVSYLQITWGDLGWI